MNNQIRILINFIPKSKYLCILWILFVQQLKEVTGLCLQSTPHLAYLYKRYRKICRRYNKKGGGIVRTVCTYKNMVKIIMDYIRWRSHIPNTLNNIKYVSTLHQTISMTQPFRPNQQLDVTSGTANKPKRMYKIWASKTF